MSTEELVHVTVQLHQFQSSEGESQVKGFCVCFLLLKIREVSEVGVLTTTKTSVR